MSEKENSSDTAPREDDAVDSSAETVADEETVEEGHVSDPGIEPEGPRYDLGDPLGEGSMAVVYTATDRNLERTVAIKCLRDPLAAKAEVLQRFFDEARILGTLGHPGAIPIHEAGRLPDGRFYYAMKQVEGRTLAKLLAERSPEEIRDRHQILRFVDLFARICETMAAAHAERVIHRDLKPENIMVDEFGAVYVMDWGLAKRLDPDGSAEESDRTRLGAVMGTPAYMSPEQASGQSLHSDCQSDVFSLGVILYEILTGSNPFGASSAQHAMKGVLYHDPDAPRKLNPRIDRALSALCMKALHKDPYRRYPTAREFVEDIGRFRRFLPVSAAKPRWLDRVYYWSKRRPALAAAAATFASLSLIVGLGLGFQAYLEDQALEEAYEELDEALEEVDDLESTLREVEGQLAEPTLTDGQRKVLVARRRLLESLIDINRGAVVGATWAVDTIFEEDGRAEALGRDDYLKLVNEAVEEKDWVQAYALLTFIRTRIREGEGHPFTPEAIARIEKQYAQVHAEIKSRGLESAFDGIEVFEWKEDD